MAARIPTREISARRRQWWTSPSVVVLCVIGLLLFVMPVIMVFIGAFRGIDGSWSTDTFVTVMGSPMTYQALLNTVILTVCAVPIGVGLAVAMCWLAVRTDSPLRRLVTPVMALLFTLPWLFYAVSWTMLAQSPSGTLNRVFQLVTGDPQLAPFDIISWPGMIIVASLKIAAISYLILLGPFSSVTASLEEAARMSGASRLRAFFGIELPVLAPALSSAIVLAVVICFAILDVPLLLGSPVGIDVLASEVYSYVNESVPADYTGANVLAIIVVVCVSIVVIAQNLSLRKRQFVTVGAKSGRRETIKLGRYRWVGAAAIVLFTLVALVLPLGQIVLGSFQPYAGVFQNLGLKNYEQVLADPRVIRAFGTTLWVALGSGLIATGLAMWISIVSQRSSSALRNVPQYMTLVLLAVPGLTIALGILAVVISVPALHFAYGTPALNLIALVIAMTPIANRLTAGAVAQVGVELEEAARTSGAPAWRATVGILVRLVLPSFFASWFITAIIAAGNLEIPVLLSSPNTETATVVALKFFQLGQYTQASAIACLMLAAIAMLMGGMTAFSALRRASVRRRGQAPASAPGSPTPGPATPQAAVEPIVPAREVAGDITIGEEVRHG